MSVVSYCVLRTVRSYTMSSPIRTKVLQLSENELSMQAATAVESLMKGNIIAVPTDTIYGVAGLAQSSEAVNRLYNIKSRDPAKPVAISVADVSDIYRWSRVTVPDELLHDLLPGPVTVVFERNKNLNVHLNPQTSLVGIRIPQHDFVRKLTRACNEPLALTSANISSHRSPLSVEEFRELWPSLDLVFDGGVLSECSVSRLGSTVVDLSVVGKFKIIRAGSAEQSTVDILQNKYDLREIAR
ncbi:hypothetical protein ScPMuIL_012965 [Solemya velum]